MEATASKGMMHEYVAAVHLIEELWFTEQFISKGAGTIDWKGLKDYMETFSPSHTEISLVNLAHGLFFGKVPERTLSELRARGDSSTRRTVLEALEAYFDYSL